MRRYYMQSGLWMSVIAVLIFGGLYVAADLNATDRPSNALNIDGEFWSGPGFALDKMSGRSTKIALGPNANAVVGVDIDASGNQMNDGNTSGTAVAGTDVVVEIFITGLAGPIVGGVVTFDTDKLTVKSATPATGFFALGTTANTVSFGAVPSGTLTNDYFGTVTLSPVEGLMASTEFTVGVSVVSLAGAANPTDTDDITTAMMSPINFNTASFPDFDGDGTVGFSDFLQFAGQYGARQGDGQYESRFDLDGDGAISFSDFLAFASSYGTQVPPSGGGGGGGSSGSPDLVVDSPSVSDSTLTTGQSFTLSATVRNQGTGSSASTTLRYYQSSNSAISTNDTEVGTDNVGGLSASGTSAESISLNAPSSAGTYYYGACVNSVTGESDTNNNCSDAVTVTVSSSGSGGGGGGGSSQACTVGLTLNPGDGCSGSTYSLQNDSGVLVLDGNIGGFRMGNTRISGNNVNLNGLILTRSGNVWTIVSLP